MRFPVGRLSEAHIPILNCLDECLPVTKPPRNDPLEIFGYASKSCLSPPLMAAKNIYGLDIFLNAHGAFSISHTGSRGFGYSADIESR
jgi:hypothetical protein